MEDEYDNSRQTERKDGRDGGGGDGERDEGREGGSAREEMRKEKGLDGVRKGERGKNGGGWNLGMVVG